MKNIAITATIVLISLGSSICISCNDNANNKINDNIDTMSSRIDANADEVKDDYEDYKDERFINDVLETNEKEVHLLNLAIQKSTSTAIKAHAKKMLADHKKMDVDLRAYANANNFEISYKTDVKSALDEDMASVEWDKKWLDKMIDEHEDVIKKFERKEKKVDEGGLKTIVVNTLPTLRDHLNSVKSLEEKM